MSDAEDRLLQFEKNQFYFNWRRRDTTQTYPHYAQIIKDFERYFEDLKETLLDLGFEPLKINRLELSYVNAVLEGEGWQSLGDISSIMRDLRWESTNRFLPIPRTIFWHAEFVLPDDKGQLTIVLKHGQRRSDGLKTLILELSAQGAGSDTTVSGMRDWFELAHQWIVEGFADITNKTTQADLWKRTV